MKQIFLKVYPNGKTSTNATVLNFDREHNSCEIVIDYSEVSHTDWIKQLDLVFADETHTFVEGTGNTLTVPLLESYLKKGTMTVQPLAKRLVGETYEKVKWQVVALSVRDSLNVLENDTSITPSIAEQWEIRIDAVEEAELVRVSNEGIRISNENTRISNENTRILQESSRVSAESTRVSQENARNVFASYNGSTAYVVGNKVSYNGSSYVCILNSTGNLPTNTTYWLLIASKGDQGIQGEVSLAQLNDGLANKADKLFATNLVTNGDFSNGTTGWTPIGVTGFSVVSGIAKFTATTTQGVIYTQYSIISEVNKYYFKAIVKANSNMVRLGVSSSIGSSYVNHSGSGQFETLSGIYTSQLTETYIRPLIRDFRTSGFTEIEVDNVISINLTSIFGAGKEPTKEQMDWLLAQKFTNSWFNGTQELTSITDLLTLVNTKANSIQNAFITPTLLNSRTGTLKYYKDSLGRICLKGTASGGSLNTNIMVFAVGDRPIETLTFPINANGAYGVATIDSSGQLRQTVGALTNVSFDGITFRSEA